MGEFVIKTFLFVFLSVLVTSWLIFFLSMPYYNRKTLYIAIARDTLPAILIRYLIFAKAIYENENNSG